MGDKVCNRCGKKGLGWDLSFHQKMGKWKLENHKREDGKWCNKPPEIIAAKKWDFIKCDLCLGNSGYCLTEEAHKRNPQWHYISLEEHKKLWHDNGRTMSELDFKMEMGMHTMYLKYWTSDPNFHRYEHLYKA